VSRSYRKPYAYVCGLRSSSHEDKTIASRAYRRLANSYTIEHYDEDDFLVPHRRDANYNDPWGWSRDGNARYYGGKDVRTLTYLGIPPEERAYWVNRWLEMPGTTADWEVFYRRK